MKWIIDVLKKFSKRKEPFTPSLAHSLSLMCEWIKKAGRQGVKGFHEVITIYVETHLLDKN